MTATASFALARYNANGRSIRLRQSGKVMARLGLGDVILFGIAFRTNGKLFWRVIPPPLDHDFSLVGYTANGTLDSTFGIAVL